MNLISSFKINKLAAPGNKKSLLFDHKPLEFMLISANTEAKLKCNLNLINNQKNDDLGNIYTKPKMKIKDWQIESKLKKRKSI